MCGSRRVHSASPAASTSQLAAVASSIFTPSRPRIYGSMVTHGHVSRTTSRSINPGSPAPPETPITKKVCEAVFQAVHKDMRELLDFHTIYPLLNSRHLLRPGLDQAILTNPTITHERRIDVLISWLPKCELSDYLTPFVESLAESSDQAGDAHRELAAMMQLQLQKEMLRLQSKLVCSKSS